MKKIFVFVLFFNVILVYAQGKVVTKNGKEIEVNKDATSSEKGIVRLTGDLGGTADAPTVPSLATKQNALTLTTTGSGAASLIQATLNIPTPVLGSPFTLQGTATDAGTNKTNAIDRSGSITVNSGFVRANSGNYSLTMNATEPLGPRFQLGSILGGVGEFFEIGAYNSQNNFDTKARDLQFFGNGTGNSVGLMLKANSGYFGVGTVTPLARLVVNDNSYIASLPTTTANLMNNTLFRPLTRFQTTSGVNNNAISHYLTTTAAATQAHNYSNGLTLPYILQPVGGNVGIGINNPLTTLQINNPTLATNTINADAQVLRLSRPQTVSTKWDNIAQFNLGSYSNTTVSASSRLDLALNDGAGTTTSNVMTWQANGNVGIGTTAPISTLSNTSTAIQGSNSTSAFIGGLTWSTPGSGFAGSFYSQPLNGNGLQVKVAGNTSSNNALEISSGSAQSGATTPLFNVLGNGNVGIGTTAPISRFDVISASTTDVARFTTSLTAANYAGVGIGNASGAWGKIASGEGKFQIRNFSTDAVIMNAELGNGNVGIGTVSPGSRLDVNGSFGTNIRSVSATSTLLNTDHTIVITGTAITTQTLPAPNNRQFLEIKNKSTRTVILTGHIDNVAATNYTLAAESSITLKSDGITWWIIDDTQSRFVAPIYQTASMIGAPGTTPAAAVDLIAITLPTAGRWRLRYSVRAFNGIANGGFAVCIADAFNTAQPNSEMMVIYSATAVNIQLTSNGFYDVVTTAPNTVFKLRGYSVNNANSGASLSDGNFGRTFIAAEKLN